MRTLTRHPLEWTDVAPIRVVAARRIAAPPAAVWAAIADHTAWPTWFRQLKRVTPGPVADAVGGTRQVELGPVTVDEEFLAFEPERRFAFVLTQSSRPGLRAMVEDIRLEPDGDGTRIEYVQAIDLFGASVVGRLIRRPLTKALQGGLDGLARHVER